MKEKNNKKAAADHYPWHIQVRSAAHLDCWIKDYFDRLTVSHQRDGTTIITGELVDLSAVYGLILKLRDAGVDLLSLQAKRL